jgi:hypothetical protein
MKNNLHFLSQSDKRFVKTTELKKDPNGRRQGGLVLTPEPKLQKGEERVRREIKGQEKSLEEKT